MAALSIGYARCSTDNEGLNAQRDGLIALGVKANRIYVDMIWKARVVGPGTPHHVASHSIHCIIARF